MEARGFKVELVVPDAEFDTQFANIFVMCERGPILDRLKNAEKSGSIVVNSTDAIRNTYRHRMVELFARHGVSMPRSQVVASDTKKPRPPSKPGAAKGENVMGFEGIGAAGRRKEDARFLSGRGT